MKFSALILSSLLLFAPKVQSFTTPLSTNHRLLSHNDIERRGKAFVADSSHLSFPSRKHPIHSISPFDSSEIIATDPLTIGNILVCSALYFGGVFLTFKTEYPSGSSLAKARLADEAKVAEEEKLVEEERLAAEEKLAAEERLAAETKVAEEIKIAEETVAEALRVAKEARLAEKDKIAEEEKKAVVEPVVETPAKAISEMKKQVTSTVEAEREKNERLKAREEAKKAEIAKVEEKEENVTLADSSAPEKKETGRKRRMVKRVLRKIIMPWTKF